MSKLDTIFIFLRHSISSCISLCLFYIFRIFPLDKNKICVTNFNGKGYGDNPKYIVEEILKRNLNYKIVWCVQNAFKDSLPKSVKPVRFKSIKSIYEEVTAKIWIDNCRKQVYVRKRKGQFYIQTWHGLLKIKKVEKDAENQLSAYYVKQAKHDSTLINLFLSDSTFCTNIYISAFWYTGEILECGCPRDDVLFNPVYGIKEKVRKYFNIAGNTKIILYAPTFRDNFDMAVYNLDYELILSAMRQQTEEPWIFLIRLHPNISKKSRFFAYNEMILNATSYADMQELLLASDILITDYSDSMYGFSIMNKPAFLYIKDYEEYKKERGFYLDILSLPFPSAMNMHELLEKMRHFDNKSYLNALKVFYQKVGIVKEGIAAARVVDRIRAEIQRK